MERNKKIIVGVVIFIAILMCGFLIVTKSDKKESEINSIRDITFSGFKLGGKSDAEMQIIYDASYGYMYEEVGLSIDKNGIIYFLCFYSSFDVDGNGINSIEDAKISYKGNLLKTYDDFIEYFGEGSISRVEDSNLEEVTYIEENVTLTLTLRNGNLINVELEEDFNKK